MFHEAPHFEVETPVGKMLLVINDANHAGFHEVSKDSPVVINGVSYYGSIHLTRNPEQFGRVKEGWSWDWKNSSCIYLARTDWMQRGSYSQSQITSAGHRKISETFHVWLTAWEKEHPAAFEAAEEAQIRNRLSSITDEMEELSGKMDKLAEEARVLELSLTPSD